MGARPWAAAGMAAATAGVLATFALAQWAEGDFARTSALRTAATTAAYLELVTPAAVRGSADYDVAQLLIQARALTTLPGWTAPVEVYHGTAPLVDASAPPLPAAALARLRLEAEGRWRDGAALVPLKDRDDWEIVGAVAIRSPRGRGPAAAVWALLVRWALPAALLTLLAAGAVAFRGDAPRGYIAAALLLALATYADVRGAARRGTDQWLAGTRLLLQEAATRLPIPRSRVAVADLAALARGADLVEADSGAVEPRRVRVAGAPRAVVTARLGSGRWIQVRTLPAEAYTTGWLLVLLGVSLASSLAVLGLSWAERAATRPAQRRETVAAWAFLAPAGLHLAVFSFGSMAFALYLSTHRWAGGRSDPARPFVGLANLGAVLRDPLAWLSLRHTVLYALYVPVSMAIALLLALALDGRGRVKRLARTAFLLPYACSVVGVALGWQSLVGRGPLAWLSRPQTALLALMILSVWLQVGCQMIVFLAGLQRIPRAYLDAARVDGAGAWQRFWRVTVPLLRPVTLFVLVTGVIGAFQVFTYVYVLTAGGPLHSTEVVTYRIYQAAWEVLQFGYASALSLMLFAVLFGVTWTQFRLLGKRAEYA